MFDTCCLVKSGWTVCASSLGTVLGVGDVQTYIWLLLLIVSRLRVMGLYLAILYCMSVGQRRRHAWHVTSF